MTWPKNPLSDLGVQFSDYCSGYMGTDAACSDVAVSTVTDKPHIWREYLLNRFTTGFP